MIFGKKRRLQKTTQKIANDFLRAYRMISKEYPGESKKKIYRRILERELGVRPDQANSIVKSIPASMTLRNLAAVVVGTSWGDPKSLDGEVYLTEIDRIIPSDL